MCVNPAPDFSPPPPRCFFPSLYLGNIPTMLMSQASIFSVLAPMLTKSFFVLFCQSPVSRDGEHDFMIKVALDKCNRRREHIAAEGLLLFSSFFPSWLLQPFFFLHFQSFPFFASLKCFVGNLTAPSLPFAFIHHLLKLAITANQFLMLAALC